MESVKAPGATVESPTPSALQKLVPAGSGLSKVSTRPYEGIDGTTNDVDVLHVQGAKAVIIVQRVKDGWRPETLFGELRKVSSENLEAFSKKARQLAAENLALPTFTDRSIGPELKRLAREAKVLAPGENPNIHSKKRKLSTPRI